MLCRFGLTYGRSSLQKLVFCTLHRGRFLGDQLVEHKPAFAWGSDVHTALVQLSGNIKDVPGVARSRPGYILPEAMEHTCTNVRRAMRLKNPFYEFLCGSDDPDSRRKWIHAISHQKDAAVRARRAFACSLYGQVTYGRGRKPVWHAARQLGHSIHYLQDIADPSKKAGRHKAELQLGIE